MALYKDLGQFYAVCELAGQPDNNLIAGMHILSSDYEYFDPKVGQNLIALAIGRADVGLEDIYGTALLAGNVFDDISKNEELGAKLVIDSAERGNVECVFIAALCLIGGIGVDRDAERAKMISFNAINSCTSEQDRSIALKTDESIVLLILKYEQDPVAAQELIAKKINDLGLAVHEDLLEANGGRLFNQEVVNGFEINEFDGALSKSSSEATVEDTAASSDTDTDASMLFEAAFSSDVELDHPVLDGEVREYVENSLRVASNTKERFNTAFELLSTCYEEGGALKLQNYMLKALRRTEDQKLRSFALWDCALALITGEVFDDIKQDTDLAIKLLEVGDEKEDPSAQYMLAICYFLGAGVDFDPEKAIAYWVKSEANGFVCADQREKAISLPREEFQKQLIKKLKEQSLVCRMNFEDKEGRTTFCFPKRRSEQKSDFDALISQGKNKTPSSNSKNQSSKGFFGKLFGR